MENIRTLQSLNADSGEENRLEDETIKEIPGVEHGVAVNKETQREVMEKQEEQKKTGDERVEESINPAPWSDLCPSILAEEQRENRSACDLSTETTISSPNPDPLPPIQRRQPSMRGSHLTRRDKRIIEKIRSYYEAAAKAEEDDTEEDDEQVEGVASRRRNSFSQIPSGLVRESVSRFNVSRHQGEIESDQPKYETVEVNERKAEILLTVDPIYCIAPPSEHEENDGEADELVSSLEFDAEGTVSTVPRDKGTPNQVDFYPNRPDEEEAEVQERNRNVSSKSSEDGLDDREEVKTCAVGTGQEEGSSITKQDKCRDEKPKASAGNQTVVNGHEPNQAAPAQSNGSHKETPREPVPHTEHRQKPETKVQSSWTRNSLREPAKTNRNLDGLPNQIIVGRWSHHSRIVAANRALFEAMGSDVAGIGLFEATPVVDPVLIENSERILSKVQTLAQMYSTKASTMKVPLHQKRANTALKPSWGSARLSGNPQNQTKSQAHVQSQTQILTTTEHRLHSENRMENNQSDTGTEAKYKAQSHFEAKVQSQTTAQMQQSQIQTKSLIQTQYQIQNQNKTNSQSQTQAIKPAIKEGKMIKRAEGLTNCESMYE